MSRDLGVASIAWRKSSYSGTESNNCVEVGAGVPGAVPVRDSKDSAGPALIFSGEAWGAFIAAIKAGGVFPAG